MTSSSWSLSQSLWRKEPHGGCACYRLHYNTVCPGYPLIILVIVVWLNAVNTMKRVFGYQQPLPQDGPTAWAGLSSSFWSGGCTGTRFWWTAVKKKGPKEESQRNGRLDGTPLTGCWVEGIHTGRCFYLPPAADVLSPEVIQVDHGQPLHQGLPGVRGLGTGSKGHHVRSPGVLILPWLLCIVRVRACVCMCVYFYLHFHASCASRLTMIWGFKPRTAGLWPKQPDQ